MQVDLSLQAEEDMLIKSDPLCLKERAYININFFAAQGWFMMYRFWSWIPLAIFVLRL